MVFIGALAIEAKAAGGAPPATATMRPQAPAAHMAERERHVTRNDGVSGWSPLGLGARSRIPCN